MSGYTIDQLLKWTLEDHLIDSYAIGSNGKIEICRGGRKHVLMPQSAEQMLCDLIRRINPEASKKEAGTR